MRTIGLLVNEMMCCSTAGRWPQKALPTASSPSADGRSAYAVLNDTLFKVRCDHECRARRMFGAVGLTPPVVAGGRVFIASVERIYALPATCSHSRCEPIWMTEPVGLLGDLGAPAPVVGNGNVFVPTPDGSLVVVPTDCPASRRVCKSLSLGEFDGSSFAPAAVGEGLVAVSVDLDPRGSIAVFPADCSGLCEPVWSSPVAGPSGVSAPAIGDGKVFISAGGRLYAFSVS